jgi:hypothetical protein
MSIIYTTHYMEEAERLCDRVAIVDHGKIIAQGTNAELVQGCVRIAQPSAGAFCRPRERMRLGRPTRRAARDGAAQFTVEHPTEIAGLLDDVRKGRPRTRGCLAAQAQPGIRLPALNRKGVARLISPSSEPTWSSLRRDRAAQGLALSFILPIVFFSIFAVIFGGRRDTTPKVSVIVVDEDHSRASRGDCSRVCRMKARCA